MCVCMCVCGVCINSIEYYLSPKYSYQCKTMRITVNIFKFRIWCTYQI